MPEPSAAQTDCPACEEGYICRQGEGCLLVEVFGDEQPAATVEQRLATRLACPHKHTYVKRTPPTWASDPYPAVVTEECEDCGKLVAVTNVERPKS